MSERWEDLAFFVLHRESCMQPLSSAIDSYPFLQVISETFIRSSSQGLEGMFAKVLDFVPAHCRVLRDITCPGTRSEPLTVTPKMVVYNKMGNSF